MLGVTEQNNTLVVLVWHMATLQCTFMAHFYFMHVKLEGPL